MDHPALYFDLEGAPLSRDGTISLIAVYVHSKQHVYLIDVHTLQSTAFDTATPDGTTLRAILQSPAITKVFFDIRKDAEALHAHFDIALRGIEDVQLMENALRSDRERRFLNGLDRCIELDAGATPAEMRAWREIKRKGLGIFQPKLGGSYGSFEARPLDPDLLAYCINDVVFLPDLRQAYLRRLNGMWRARVVLAAERRVLKAQGPVGNSKHDQNAFWGQWEKPESAGQVRLLKRRLLKDIGEV